MPDSEQVRVVKTDPRYRHPRIAVYLLSILLAAVTGYAMAFSESEAYSWLGLVMGMSFAVWAAVDAKYQHRPLPTLSLWVVFLFWPIAVPVCVVRLYGWIAGLVYVVLHVLLLIIFIYGPWLLATLAAEA